MKEAPAGRVGGGLRLSLRHPTEGLELHQEELRLDATYRVTTVCSSATANREVVWVCRLLKVPPVPSEPVQSTRQVIVYVAVTWSSPPTPRLFLGYR